jgi:hypothetical protein
MLEALTVALLEYNSVLHLAVYLAAETVASTVPRLAEMMAVSKDYSLAALSVEY